jgi:hypothetical protein
MVDTIIDYKTGEVLILDNHPDVIPKEEKDWNYERIYELVGHDGIVHYTRPANHPDIKDAFAARYKVREKLKK